MLVFGRNVAKEILKSDKKVEKIIIQEDFKDDAFDNISLYAKETDSLLNWTDLEPIIEWDNYSSFNNSKIASA